MTEIEQMPLRQDVVYVFGIDKADAFINALQSIPSEEIGFLQVWTALKKKKLLFSDEKLGNIFDFEPVFCLQTDFKEEHAFLRKRAESESLFYHPVYDDNKQMINLFFELDEQRPQFFVEYMQSIGKM